MLEDEKPSANDKVVNDDQSEPSPGCAVRDGPLAAPVDEPMDVVDKNDADAAESEDGGSWSGSSTSEDSEEVLDNPASPDPDAENGDQKDCHFENRVTEFNRPSDDERSQTPLQDEPESAEEGAPLNCNTDIPGPGRRKVPNNTRSLKTEDPSKVYEESLRPGIRDDHGELDYDEEENQDVAGMEALEEPDGDEDVKKKSSKKSKKKKSEKTEKAGQEEKEEGEELEEGEESASESEKSTDGELDDDDDCEEGEIKDASAKKPFVRPICRFYMRGSCTWGTNCRFLHPGINDKGNYAMIDPMPFPPPMPPGMMGPMIGPGGRPLPPPVPWMHDGPRRIPRGPMDMGPPVMEPELAPPPPTAEAAGESAWERGLRHAKEIRKKRKETDPADDKKDGNTEEDRRSASPPARDPPSRETFYDEPQGPPAYDEAGEFYGRPPMPMPPEMWGPYRPPFDPFDPRWGRGLPPPPFMPPPPDFRLPEHERMRRFSPPHPGRFDPRRDGRYGPWFDRYPPEGPMREPPVGPGGEGAPPARGRGEEWKDPWLRSKSPKRTRHSSSRSASRGRRRYKTRSKGSYSSVSSSSYSSSRSRSSSSSSYSSYSRSSRSSYSSRSSSRSRSRSPVRRKPLPSTTLGQSLLEKRKISETPRGIAAQTEGLLIGSGPLPPRAPPEKKAPAAAVLEQPSASSSNKAGPSSDQKPSPVVPAAVPPPQKTVPNPPVLAKLPSRAPLQPVCRGVAAAFADAEEDEDSDSADDKELPSKSLPSSTVKGPLKPMKVGPSSPPDVIPSAKESLPVPSAKLGSGVQQSLEKGAGKMLASGDKDVRNSGSIQSSGAAIKDINKGAPRLDRSNSKGSSSSLMHKESDPRAKMPTGKPEKGRGEPVSDKKSSGYMKGAPHPGTLAGSATEWKDPWDRSRPEKARHVAGRASSSTSRSGSRSSAESHRSLSSLSSSSGPDSEHLYRDIASPISSASSPSPVRSPHAKVKPEAKAKLPTTPPQRPPSKVPHPDAIRPESHRLEKPREPARNLIRDGAGEPVRDDRREREMSREMPASHRSSQKTSEASRTAPKDAGREAWRETAPRDSSRAKDPRLSSGSHGVGHHRENSNKHSAAGQPALPSSVAVMSGESRSRTVPASRSSAPRRSSDNGAPQGIRAPGAHHSTSELGPSGSMKTDTRPPKSENSGSSMPLQLPPASSASRKRPVPQDHDELPMKMMRHGTDTKEPVKIPLPKLDKSQKPTAVSPSHSGRSLATRPAMPSASAPRSPGRAVQHMPSKPPTSPGSSGNTLKRKSMSSRREQLLLQLRAVEDAIAKKRSKLQ